MPWQQVARKLRDFREKVGSGQSGYAREGSVSPGSLSIADYLKGAGNRSQRPTQSSDAITEPRGKDTTGRADDDILDSSGPADAEQFDKPFPIKAGKLDAARFQLQDKFIDMLRIQEGVEASTRRVLDDAENVKQAAELFTSKSAAQIEDFRENVEKPIVDFMHKGGLDVREVDDWLMARHAAERNRRMQEINPRVDEVWTDGMARRLLTHDPYDVAAGCWPALT